MSRRARYKPHNPLSMQPFPSAAGPQGFDLRLLLFCGYGESICQLALGSSEIAPLHQRICFPAEGRPPNLLPFSLHRFPRSPVKLSSYLDHRTYKGNLKVSGGGRLKIIYEPDVGFRGPRPLTVQGVDDRGSVAVENGAPIPNHRPWLGNQVVPSQTGAWDSLTAASSEQSEHPEQPPLRLRNPRGCPRCSLPRLFARPP
jgi:hypothetical protein